MNELLNIPSILTDSAVGVLAFLMFVMYIRRENTINKNSKQISDNLTSVIKENTTAITRLITLIEVMVNKD